MRKAKREEEKRKEKKNRRKKRSKEKNLTRNMGQKSKSELENWLRRGPTTGFYYWTHVN